MKTYKMCLIHRRILPLKVIKEDINDDIIRITLKYVYTKYIKLKRMVFRLNLPVT